MAKKLIENKDIDDLEQEEAHTDGEELTLDEMVEGVPDEIKEDLKNKIMKKVKKNKKSDDSRISEHPLSDQQKYLDAYINENRPIGSDEADFEVIEATADRLEQEKYKTYNLFLKVGEDRKKLVEKIVTNNNNVPIFDADGKVVTEKAYKPIMEKYIVRKPTLSEEIDLTRLGVNDVNAIQFMSDDKFDSIKEEMCRYMSDVIVEPELSKEELMDTTSDKITNLFAKCEALQKITDDNLLMDFFTEY
jgi:hypothetical protein